MSKSKLVPIISPSKGAIRFIRKEITKLLEPAMSRPDGELYGVTLIKNVPVGTLMRLLDAVGKKETYFNIMMDAVKRFPEKEVDGAAD